MLLEHLCPMIEYGLQIFTPFARGGSIIVLGFLKKSHPVSLTSRGSPQ